MSNSLLSISNIMPVIFPASSGWILVIAGKSFSPIICFWTAGGELANTEAFKGALEGVGGGPCIMTGMGPLPPCSPGIGGLAMPGIGIIPFPIICGGMPFIIAIICGPPIIGPRGPIPPLTPIIIALGGIIMPPAGRGPIMPIIGCPNIGGAPMPIPIGFIPPPMPPFPLPLPLPLVSGIPPFGTLYLLLNRSWRTSRFSAKPT
mmetsp:Transcript_67131/g.106285  ORF Transcript_67131/g.106285 Transcript_67131/m.106285 type:complete len:204 (-) Transcript_67131:1087-1698(-)